MPTLLDFAQRSGIAFESSPSGRWVKFLARRTQVYVVEGAWGNNYLVWAGEEPASLSAIEHYMRPEEALDAVFRLAA